MQSRVAAFNSKLWLSPFFVLRPSFLSGSSLHTCSPCFTLPWWTESLVLSFKDQHDKESAIRKAFGPIEDYWEQTFFQPLPSRACLRTHCSCILHWSNFEMASLTYIWQLQCYELPAGCHAPPIPSLHHWVLGWPLFLVQHLRYVRSSRKGATKRGSQPGCLVWGLDIQGWNLHRGCCDRHGHFGYHDCCLCEVCATSCW